VNTAFLLMSTTLVAGQESPPPAAAPAPVLVQPAPTWPSPAYGVPGGGCSSCGAGIAPGCSDPCPCEGRKGLFSRLRGKDKDCDCSPKEKRRLFKGFTTSAADCGGEGGGLFSRLGARFHNGGNNCDSGCSTVGGCGASAWGGPTVGGCALPPVPSYSSPVTPGVITPAPPTEAPKQMEKEAPKTDGTKNVSHSLPAPAQLPVPAIPVLADSKSPF
jgi:hypothetical protein